MLVWLASYPRSGNTFLRTILNQCFDLQTQSLHGEGDDRTFSTQALRDAVGHVSTGLANQELIDFAQRSTEPVLIKTHEPPLTSDKTIHIVRDGRSALISYFHFLRDVEGVDVPLEHIIRGEVYAGSWSQHYRDWCNQPDRLLLRYEEVSTAPDTAVKALSDFLGVPAKRQFTRTFTEMQQLKPNFFRKGDDAANIAEMQPYADEFSAEHGDVMRALGYESF